MNDVSNLTDLPDNYEKILQFIFLEDKYLPTNLLNCFSQSMVIIVIRASSERKPGDRATKEEWKIEEQKRNKNGVENSNGAM